MITARAPGKLFIAGEYAVVEPRHPAILVAVDRHITVTVTESSGLSRIHSAGRPALEWRFENGVVTASRHSYVTRAIDVIERLREERGLAPLTFDLTIESELEDNGRKFGLGSSAAVVVATIAAMNDVYGLGLSAIKRTKLALLATIAQSPRASGGDVAASTFGGWIFYRSPDRAILAAESTVSEALKSPGWQGFEVRPLPAPTLDLMVGWSGSPASTQSLVDGVTRANPSDFSSFLTESDSIVQSLATALDDGDSDTAQRAVREARQNLRRLQATTGIAIETDRLAALCDLAEARGAAAKLSGAGGGDCGIALGSADPELLRAWEGAGIVPLDLKVQEADA
ncbi:phosphomevalonate kinase [Flaviflexus huanghaiensis]|uniref:phosphomevalonate kinase n=1 Tax=Flaviflexus huanghaiensis TaxID=1111473 RepID=UPI0015F9FF1C